MSQSPLLRAATTAIVLAMSASVLVSAQRGQQAAPAPVAPTPKAQAPLDLEGYWVSVVTEDWRWRMMTPAKGDAPGVPLSLAGRKLADAWDLAKDNAGGQATQCKAYGAGGITRIPGRLHITWQDENTLKIEYDAGRQTRLYHFLGPLGEVPRNEQPSMQGYTLASWTARNTGAPILNEEVAPGRGGRAGGRGPAAPQKGSLKAMTTNLRAGYFRKNGLPYSDNATLTEYFDRHADFGAEWFTVLSVLNEPTYLVSPFVTTTHFKREPDGSKWNPQACETLPPTAPLSRGENVG